jgi:hypothetical protein
VSLPKRKRHFLTVGDYDSGLNHWFAELNYFVVVRVWKVDRIADESSFTVPIDHFVGDARRGDDDVGVVFVFQSLPKNVHMQGPEKT